MFKIRKDFNGNRACKLCNILKPYIFSKFNDQGKRLFVDNEGRYWNGAKCRDCLNKDIAKINRNNRECINVWTKEYRKRFPLKRKGYNISTAIRQILKCNQQKSKYNKIFGLSCDDLRSYIESLFKPNMNWENYGKNGWEIDHIIPQSKAKTLRQLYKLNHHTNLRPVWKRENRIKYNKIIIEQIALR